MNFLDNAESTSMLSLFSIWPLNQISGDNVMALNKQTKKSHLFSLSSLSQQVKVSRLTLSACSKWQLEVGPRPYQDAAA